MVNVAKERAKNILPRVFVLVQYASLSDDLMVWYGPFLVKDTVFTRGKAKARTGARRTEVNI